MRVVQITDLHLTESADLPLNGVNTTKTLEKVLQQVEILEKPADLMIITGDIAQGGSVQTYRRFKEIMSYFDKPIYVLPGNNDDPLTMKSVLNSDGFHAVGQAVVGYWGFVFLDSKVEGQTYGRLSSEQMLKLEENLESMKDQPVLVALHHCPSHVCTFPGCSFRKSQELADLLNQYPNAKATIAGHTHHAHEFDAGNHIQFTTPSTYTHIEHKSLNSNDEYPDFASAHVFNSKIHAFRTLDLFENGSIQSDVHWIKSE